MLKTKEHEDLIAQFEKDFGIVAGRAQKEPKDIWNIGRVYCHGETNELFLAYRRGYAFGKCEWRNS